MCFSEGGDLLGEILQDLHESDESEAESVVSKKSAKATPSIESIGPPKILQYKPETKKIEITAPSPSLSLDSDPIENLGMFLRDFNVYTEGGQTCEFCGKRTREWPTIHSQDHKSPDELYCCNDYQEFVEGLIDYQNEKEKLKTGEVILKPISKKQSKKAKKLAKERAEFRYFWGENNCRIILPKSPHPAKKMQLMFYSSYHMK